MTNKKIIAIAIGVVLSVITTITLVIVSNNSEEKDRLSEMFPSYTATTSEYYDIYRTNESIGEEDVAGVYYVYIIPKAYMNDITISRYIVASDYTYDSKSASFSKTFTGDDSEYMEFIYYQKDPFAIFFDVSFRNESGQLVTEKIRVEEK